MWIDTRLNGEYRLINMRKQKQLHMESNKRGTAYQLQLGTGTFGQVIGIFPDSQAAIAEYEKICTALKDGLHYYKISEATKNDEPVDPAA